MLDWAGAFKDDVIYAARMAEFFGMTRPTYIKARDKLIEAGFIYWTNKAASSYLHNEAGQFEFSDEWHTKKKRSEPP